jgi:transposase, IS30 family
MPGARLSEFDRQVIERGLRDGLTVPQIASAIGRHRTTVAREIDRGAGSRPVRRYRPVRLRAVGETRPGRRPVYRAAVAQERARRKARRPKPCKLVGDFAVVVAGLLAADWSPQQVSAMLPHLFPDREDWRVSHETIYQSLFVQARGELRRELTAHLRSQRTARKPHGSRERRGRLVGTVSIRQRPAEANDRAVPGHWEGDLLMGGTGKGAVITLVERATRFVLLAPLPDSHAAIDLRAVLTPMIVTLPDQLRRTLAWDHGKEMAQHAQISLDAGIAIYFCDPHSPWQRGSNENTNGLLRQYWPKGCDMRELTQADCDDVALSLNTRPRQTLGWKTPREALDEALRATAA